MAVLSKLEQAQIKRLVQSDDWDVLTKLIAHHIADIDAEEVTGSNAFETLRKLHINTGKALGLTEFLELIEREGFKD